jgi:hypothetical protein
MLVAAIAALLLALSLVACGGGGDSSSSTTSTREQPSGNRHAAGDPSSNSASRRRAADSGKGNEGQHGGGEAADFAPKQHQDSGGGAAQYEVKGGDNSVQEYGQEADASEFEAAATALHNFLDARAQGNWEAACQYLSKDTVKSLAGLAGQLKSGAGCAGALEKIINPAAKKLMMEEAAKADIGSMRFEGDQGFLIYTAGNDTIFTMPMANEGGVWKVSALTGSALN